MKKMIYAIIIALTALIPPAAAQDFAVDISEVSILPETIYSGDTINVTVRFSVGVPSASLSSVKLSLFFDGALVDSNMATYSSGNHAHTFSYHHDGDKLLNRKITVTAKIYDAGTLEDEDSAARDIYIKPRTGIHDLQISSVSVPQSVDSNTVFNAVVRVKNNGDTREDNVQVSAIFNKKSYFASRFSIAPGETIERTIAITAPASAGAYELEAQAINAYNEDTQKTSVRVSPVFLSLSLSKSSANIGEWVSVSGYATRDGLRRAGSVTIYRDGASLGVIPTTENGYYSTQVRFDSRGTHWITAIVGDVRKDKYIYINAQESATAPKPIQTQPTATQTIVSSNYTAVIVVTPDGSKIIYPEAIAPRGKYQGFSFVNVETSTKEVGASQYSRGRLIISVTNHLGRSGLFKVETDFNEKWAYLPEADVIKDGETKNLDVYFNPDAAGSFNGSIYIFEGATLIERVPLSLFVAPPPEPIESEPAPPATARITGTQIGGAAVLFFAAAVLLYVVLRKPRALEPLNGLIPSVIERTRNAQVAENMKTQPPSPGAQGGSKQWLFKVPQRNIIM